MLKGLIAVADPIPPLIRPIQPFPFGASSCHGFRRCFPQLNTTTNTSRRKKEFQLSAQADDSQSNSDPQQQQQLNLSVLRFTFGFYHSHLLSISLSDDCWGSNLIMGFLTRDTWTGRILLAQMDRIRVRVPHCFEPFCGF